jgi:tetratricopeptide (TPR) repeat protein
MRALAAVLASTLALLAVLMLAQYISAPIERASDRRAAADSEPIDGRAARRAARDVPLSTRSLAGEAAGVEAMAANSSPPAATAHGPQVWPTPDPRDGRGPFDEQPKRGDAADRRPPGEDRLTAMFVGVDDWVARAKVRVLRDADLRTKQGARMFDAGMFAQSADAYRTATELSPADADSWIGLGRALSAGGRYEQAAVAYERAAEIYPDDAVVHFNLGVTYVRLDRLTEAIEAFRQALSIDPAHAKSLYNLATLTAMDGRLSESRHAWERLASLGGPTATEALASAGRVALRQGATDDALGFLSDAFLVRPADPSIVRPLAVAIEAESSGDADAESVAAAWRNWLTVIDPNGRYVEPAGDGSQAEQPEGE